MSVELLNIDCYDKLTTMENGSVDLFLQDTPFGVTQNAWDIAPDLKKMWPEWLRVGKENCAFIFFATQPFASDLINSNRKHFRYDLIWYKSLGTGFLNANKMPMRNHESILVFYRKLPVFNPQKSIGKMKDKGRLKESSRERPNNYGSFKDIPREINNLYNPESVIDFTNGNNQDTFHPTQKPLDLIRYLIKTYSNAGDLIFDGYGGSSTAAVACELEKRSAVVCELDPVYFAAGCKQYEDFIKQLTLF